MKLNVESFNLDHRDVSAPYIRVADVKRLGEGAVLTKYDVRFCQPNREHLEMDAVHSIEHMFAEFSRNHAPNVVDFSPMGCQTGFYLMLAGEPDVPATAALVETTFRDILAATAVPAANEVQCGWGAHHSLKGAQDAVTAMLAKRSAWEQVMAPGAPSADDAGARLAPETAASENATGASGVGEGAAS
ncbi:S-ribosylhomocysteine lyase [Arcanobacterium wilhelmae]|uniref:S-ribosylhomocysteine lyase n=1 Tax=Arcanobacterium wilhelmae TaxID=1803177 RepID=A0ABT9NB93_9ACTO|nr:S-ribosylhomocysteine lyase [Arcanobacterium wilhelmae]MDP9800977.1 S-ribosylhomocysteine lyase [Arcanobacterium wilhelmae]WFN90337.1 S-ribosylhomocysteine lyase [Arcanobacterium wilhelmae]